jgi:hypothetical protein
MKSTITCYYKLSSPTRADVLLDVNPPVNGFCHAHMALDVPEGPEGYAEGYIREMAWWKVKQQIGESTAKEHYSPHDIVMVEEKPEPVDAVADADSDAPPPVEPKSSVQPKKKKKR